MKKVLTTKQLAKQVFNMSKAISIFEGVPPMSLRMIESDIEFIANRFSNFTILIDKNYATVRVASHNCFQGDFIELKVNLWDCRFYAELL